MPSPLKMKNDHRNKFIYVNGAYGWEIIMAIFVAVLDLTRNELATIGNKTAKVDLILWSIGLSIPLIIGYCFFLCLQSYVLQLDFILNIVALTYLSLQLIVSLASVISHFILEVDRSPWMKIKSYFLPFPYQG
jgi:uncharacterized protein YacL